MKGLNTLDNMTFFFFYYLLFILVRPWITPVFMAVPVFKLVHVTSLEISLFVIRSEQVEQVEQALEKEQLTYIQTSYSLQLYIIL